MQNPGIMDFFRTNPVPVMPTYLRRPERAEQQTFEEVVQILVD
tara:strand:- start:11 stop:139 length:129 start_codon:yes stop_codon:yes gene_type:complete